MSIQRTLPVLLLISGFAHAADEPSMPVEQPFKASVLLGWIPDFNLDSGGKASATAWQASLVGNWKLDEAQRLGFSLQYGQQDWSFDQPVAWGGQTPWDTLSRASLNVTYFHINTTNGWGYAIIPGMEYSTERNASTSDSISYGLSAIVTRSLSRDKTIGLGIAASQRLDGFQVFPFPVVNWKLSDTWRITNPLQVSMVGPAGMEAVWTANSHFEMGFGATWREYQYRLAASNPITASGILSDKTIPVYMRAGYKFNESARLNAILGAGLFGEFKFLDQYDNTVSTEKHDLMPLLGLTFSGSF